MRIQKEKVGENSVRFIIEDAGIEITEVYLHILPTDVSKKPFGIVKNIFIGAQAIKKGAGKRLVEAIRNEASKRGCHELIIISQEYKKAVNGLLLGRGFGIHGIEFRIDL